MILCQDIEKVFITRNTGTPLRWAVDTLTVAKGERVLVAGPSGCGKTTLLNLLAGLLHPDRGQIVVHGQRVDEMDTAEADLFRGYHIGLVFQSFQLLAPLTVLDNLLLGARYGRKWTAAEAHTKAHTLLERVGLGARKLHRPGELSLGEQQRVAIARALINEPPLLLADEPTASLDTANGQVVMELLFDLCTEHGTTMLAVSHDPAIRDRFDRVLDAAGWMRNPAEVAHV
jgi:putative ABC transport system ATP-binding protein